MDKTKANGRANLSPADIMRADAQVDNIPPEELNKKIMALSAEVKAVASVSIVVLPGDDLRLITAGLSPNQVVHMLATVIQGLAGQVQFAQAESTAANEEPPPPPAGSEPPIDLT